MQEQFDTRRKYVRVVQVRDNGMVEFEFSIGEPELFVELLMPRAAFDQFCDVNRVEMLVGPAPEPADEEAAQFAWSLRQATSLEKPNETTRPA